MKKFLFVFIVFCAIAITTVSAQKPVDLKFNLKKGESYDYNLNADMATKGNVGGQDIDLKNTIGVSYHFTALDDSAGWKKINSTITRIIMNISTGGMNIEYDSDAPDTASMISAAFGKILGALKGGQFSFTMNGKGEIGSVTGFDAMMEKVTAAASDMGQMGDIGSSYNEDNFRQNIQQAFGGYPGKPVKPGDTWTSTSTTSNSGIQVKTDNVYKLESVEGNIANIKVDSKLSSPAGDSTASINGTSGGNIKYEIASGVAVDGDISTKLDMNIVRGGQTIPMTTDIKMKIIGKKS